MAVPYAVSLDLTDRAVLVVGGGPVAARKVAGLVRAGARVTVVAPRAVPEIADDPDVRWHRREYQRGEVASYRLAVTATGDREVDALVAADGERSSVFVNAADDPANCTFTLPAVARVGDLQVAVSTGGRSPALARWMRRRLERDLASGYDLLLELLAEVREELRRDHGTSESSGWESALDDGLLDLLRAGQIEAARLGLRKRLGLAEAGPRGNENGWEQPGSVGSDAMTVHLVGAGPGDPDLLTLRARDLLARADVVVHDRLVDRRILDLVAPWAELIDVGKRPGDPGDRQLHINALLIDRGSPPRVCRPAQGGATRSCSDGGGEEAIVLRGAGIDVAEVPGVTAAIAAPAVAGIPVTMRGVSSGFTVVTAHQDPTADQWLDWDAISRTRTTLVVLMGAGRAGIVAERLLAGGLEPDTPVAVIHAATTPTQSVARDDPRGAARSRDRQPRDDRRGPGGRARRPRQPVDPPGRPRSRPRRQRPMTLLSPTTIGDPAHRAGPTGRHRQVPRCHGPVPGR